jgi:hypothetical protein
MPSKQGALYNLRTVGSPAAADLMAPLKSEEENTFPFTGIFFSFTNPPTAENANTP